ncbi:MAG: MoxR family ATPase [Alphaproteobacteria bacterium]
MNEITAAETAIDPAQFEARIDQMQDKLGKARAQVHQVIYGQEQVVDLSLITLLAGGHLLLIGVPGLAKTLLVETLGTVLGLSNKRIQCTPDLMPSDILGSEVLEESADGKREFRFIKGPVFSQLLMADEINRASPRTQSALLQAMQEGQVSIAGQTRDLPAPFHVLATQNPLEQEGTYPLPEAQLDRFLLQVDVDYPDRETERQILAGTTGATSASAETVLDGDTLIEAQRLTRMLPISENVMEGVLDLVGSARPGTGPEEVTDLISWGPGPRAGQALILAAKARALLDGRLSPSLDDVQALAEPVLKHRMALTFAARADGETVSGVVARLAAKLS